MSDLLNTVSKQRLNFIKIKQPGDYEVLSSMLKLIEKLKGDDTSVEALVPFMEFTVTQTYMAALGEENVKVHRLKAQAAESKLKNVSLLLKQATDILEAEILQ